MFADAYTKASQFTLPVVISHRRHDGICLASIGTFVMINSDGWAVTALHIIEEIERLTKAAEQFQADEKARQKIYADSSLDKKVRGKSLKAIPQPQADTVTHVSPWWGSDQTRFTKYIGVPAVDLAFVHFDPFKAASTFSPPTFKDPQKPMPHGRSLCRIGFPFHEIQPTFDDKLNGFHLPPGALPMPLFPNEGIFTRIVEVVPQPAPDPPAPFKFRLLETSSPGLRGQSGGPIFDAQGTIWAIQSRTVHFPLGFSPPVPNGKPNEKEHQFLNIGWGVHVETIVGTMRDFGISFALSTY